MKTELHGHSLVPGISLPAAGQPFHGIDPATSQALDPAYQGIAPSGVDTVARHAYQAFQEYRVKSAKEKAEFLRVIAEHIGARIDDLVERTCAETALPEPRIRAETGRTTNQLRLFADLVEDGSWIDARIETADPDRQPLPKPDIRSMLQPLGPVVVFCASNFPLAFSVAGGDTAAALAAGCPVIVKAHHSHPGTAEIVGRAVADAVQRCQMPPGTFSLVYGSGREVGIALVRHPHVKAAGFTGSRAGGIALMKAGFERPEPIPVYAEMSSINPVFILPEALAQNGDQIARGLQSSVTLGLGQFCTNPGLVFLPHGDAADRFASALRDAMARTPEGFMLNSGIAAAYRNALDKRQTLSSSGVEVLWRQAGNAPDDPCRAGAALYRSRARTFLEEPVLSEEAFGPSTTLITYEHRGELLQAIDSLEGQLTGTIHGTQQDLAGAGEIIARLQTKIGRLIFGGFPTGVEVCHAMVHGGPYPSTSDGRSTSVGTMAVQRFVRHFCYQDAPDTALPDELKNANPLRLQRRVNGKLTAEPVR